MASLRTPLGMAAPAKRGGGLRRPLQSYESEETLPQQEVDDYEAMLRQEFSRPIIQADPNQLLRKPAHPDVPAPSRHSRRYLSNTQDPEQSQVAAQAEQTEEMTLVMLRPIHSKYSSEEVQGLLDDAGLADSYDFFHLPLNSSGKANAGYCFVNFRSADALKVCQQALQGKTLGDTSRPCRISTASDAGLIKNLKNQAEASTDAPAS